MTTNRELQSSIAERGQKSVDVLIVGAGISGIGLASHLTRRLPEKSFEIVEARENIGGTWDLFRYPGVRSDSDLHTLGYEFKPWTGDSAIADGSEIVKYLHETVQEHGLSPQLRLGWKAVSADWSSERGRWTVQLLNVASGENATVDCQWLFGATGYYNYDEGYRPHFENEEQFTGQIIHPQRWPEDLDYSGKNVVIIGSGATAITMVPAMADKAAHVTMLQRSPSYVIPIPGRDPIANNLRRILPEQLAYRITRRIYRARLATIVAISENYPATARRIIRWVNKLALPKDYPVDEHFKPRYNPWEERMCMVRDGDLFKAIRNGKASVVTDRIARFTEHGIELASGKHHDADIIITATGLKIMPLRAMSFCVDGKPVDVADTVVYKSMMLSGVPNFAFAFGYTIASWTLKVDLACEHFCRLIAHADARGLDIAVPVADDPTVEVRPMLDFQAGYVQRVADTLPRQGSHGPWSMEQSYKVDRDRLRRGPVEDPALQFSRIPAESDLALPSHA